MKEESRITNENLELTMEEIQGVIYDEYDATKEQLDANKDEIEYYKLKMYHTETTDDKTDIVVLHYGLKPTDIIVSDDYDHNTELLKISHCELTYKTKDEAIETGEYLLKELNQKEKIIHMQIRKKNKPYIIHENIVFVHWINNNNIINIEVFCDQSKFNIHLVIQRCKNKKEAEKRAFRLMLDQVLKYDFKEKPNFEKDHADYCKLCNKI